MSVTTYKTQTSQRKQYDLGCFLCQNARNLSLAACQACITAAVVAVLQAIHL